MVALALQGRTGAEAAEDALIRSCPIARILPAGHQGQAETAGALACQRDIYRAPKVILGEADDRGVLPTHELRAWKRDLNRVVQVDLEWFENLERGDFQ